MLGLGGGGVRHDMYLFDDGGVLHSPPAQLG